MKKNQGITLIALIITIIIMLILVALTVSILINSGIIGKAKKAEQDTKTAYEQEQRLGDSLNVNGRQFNSIDEYLEYLDDKSNTIDWPQVLATAQKHPDQHNSNDIGVGTDGKVVNLDLWHYYCFAPHEITLHAEGAYFTIPSYKGTFINGQIQETIPQFIKISGEDEFFPVTKLGYTFVDCSELTVTPELPKTVTNLYGTFSGCTGLTVAPKISDGITSMDSAFARCSGLTTAPEIPSSVTSMMSTFYECNSLTGDLIINANNPNMISDCLYKAATNTGCDLKLSGTSARLNDILNTKSANSNISLKN